MSLLSKIKESILRERKRKKRKKRKRKRRRRRRRGRKRKRHSTVKFKGCFKNFGLVSRDSRPTVGNEGAGGMKVREGKDKNEKRNRNKNENEKEKEKVKDNERK